MIITVFQATKQKVQPLILSLLRKGSLDIPLMIALNYVIGVKGVAWATPLADWLALIVSLLLFLPYINKIKKGNEYGGKQAITVGQEQPDGK